MVGKTISHHQILEKIGEGGMGVVWKARDLNLPRFVALKFLSSHLTDSEDARRRLRREAQAISLLSHPHIETIYEVGEYDGQLFLALEYLPQGSLLERIRTIRGAGQRSSLRDMIGCALQVAEGLAHAHRHGIVHRDVKPANILYTEENAAKITDFGLAQGFDASLSTAQSFVGTVPYMSPEQIQNVRLDHRTDIYSFGVTLFEMVTAEQPFRGPNIGAVLHAIVDTPTPSLRSLRPDASEELDRIALRAMAKDPGQRYQRMEQVVEALRRLAARTALAPESAETLTLPYPADIVRAPRPSSRRAVRRAAFLTASLLILPGTAARLWLWPQRCLVAPSAFAACRLPEVKHIGVLPFTNLSGDESDHALFSGLEEVIARELRRLGWNEKSLCIHGVGTQAGTSGFNLLVSGTTARVGDRLRVTATLSAPRTKLKLREGKVEASGSGFKSLHDGLLVQLAGMVQVPLRPDFRSGATPIRPALEPYLRGLGYLRQGRPDRLEDALKSFNQAIREDPGYPAALAGRCDAQRQQYSQTKERRWLEAALKDCYDALGRDPKEASAYLSLGQIYMDTREYDRAGDSLRQSLQLDPLDTDTRVLLAKAYMAQGRVEDAETVYGDGIRLRPDCWSAHNVYGSFLSARGRHDAAKKEYLRALELAPENPRVLNNLGTECLVTDQLEEAAKWLEKSLSLEPRAAPANNLGALYFRSGRYADSARAFKEATDLGEKDSVVWANYGEALLKDPGGNREDAGRVFARAVNLAKEELARDPTNVGVLRMLANDYARLEDHDKALDTIRDALERAPRDAEVQYRAVLVYEMVGRRKLALDALRAALSAGFSMNRICSDPDLEDLRRDPQFARAAPDGCQVMSSARPKGSSARGPAPERRQTP